MIILYMRSSSYNDYDFCEHKYFLDYVLKLPELSNKKADLGNVVHKALELLAKRKLAEQLNLSIIMDEVGEYLLDDIDVEFVVDLAFDHYVKQSPHHNWDSIDKKTCLKWVNKAISYKNGMFNPSNQNIYFVEKYFDIPIDEPWAKYDYTLNGKRVVGTLSLRGHIDLGVSVAEDTIEAIDYKTGQKKNWSTGVDKTYTDLESDFQLRLYHWALKHIYDIKNILMTIFYINHGGAFTIPFSDKDLDITLDMIKKRFLAIEKNKMPNLIFPDWKCYKLCHFGKNKQKGTDQTICNFYKDEILQLGMDKVTDYYADINKLSSYGQGGGTNRG